MTFIVGEVTLQPEHCWFESLEEVDTSRQKLELTPSQYYTAL